MSRKNTVILKGDLCFCKDKHSFTAIKDGYLVTEENRILGAYYKLPQKYKGAPIEDYSGHLIIPGLIDLHVHASQYAFRGLKMDMELLEWLRVNTFPEESKYKDAAYAEKAYGQYADDLRKSAMTRSAVFASIHTPATKKLMELLDETGIYAYVGKVNMDRNAPDDLREDTRTSVLDTAQWIYETKDRYERVKPIITPRFIPSCSDELLEMLSQVRRDFGIPVQTHLSENMGEVEWTKELSPGAAFYGDAYDRYELFGGIYPAIMAHCVYSRPEEISLMKANGVFVAHCPQSNSNLSSGIAPVRMYLDSNLNVGLGSDIAGGTSLSIFKAMTDAIQVSKLRCALVSSQYKPVTIEEAFYMGTKGGGAFFGKVGSFEAGYEFDALILDETNIPHPQELSIEERLERYCYLASEEKLLHKYVGGRKLF